MFAQSTLISYHTEAFVKTEVGCTVIYDLERNKDMTLKNQIKDSNRIIIN